VSRRKSSNHAHRAGREFREQVKRAARGHWKAILSQCGIDERFLTKSHGPCPGCGGKDRFRFDDCKGHGNFYCNQRTPPSGDGFDLLHHVHGWSFSDTLRTVAALVGVEDPKGRGRHAVFPSLDVTRLRAYGNFDDGAPPIPHRQLERIVGIQSACKNVQPDGEVICYLQSRGLGGIASDLPKDVLEHAALEYFDGRERAGTYPAMVARLRNVNAELMGLHTTYLHGGKKAPVTNPKKSHAVTPGALKGAAVALYEPTDRLAITEGIENALAVRLATGWPVWAATSAGLLTAVRIPSSVKEIVIWADHDKTGLEAAAKLEARLLEQGRTVRVQVPPLPGMDALDWLGDARGEAA
jgi:putative DNA primase/helicase